MFDDIVLLASSQRDITFGGQRLSELGARIVSAYVSSCEPDVETFQGVGRSSIAVLKNRRTGRTMKLTIDFFGHPAESERNRASFDALFLSPAPVEADLQDGYLYDVVLLKVKDGTGIVNAASTVEYTFAATRRGEWLKKRFSLGAPGRFFSQSTFPKSDCIIRIMGLRGNSGNYWWVRVNGLEFKSNATIDGTLELNGVDKTITLHGRNVTGDFIWTDFPYIIPGENVVEVRSSVYDEGAEIEVEYAPVYL